MGGLRKHSLGAPLDQHGHGRVPVVIVEVCIDLYSWHVMEGFVELSATDNVPIRAVGGEMTPNVEITPAIFGVAIVAKSTLPWTSSWGLGWVSVTGWEVASRPWCCGRCRRRGNLGGRNSSA